MKMDLSLRTLQSLRIAAIGVFWNECPMRRFGDGNRFMVGSVVFDERTFGALNH